MNNVILQGIIYTWQQNEQLKFYAPHSIVMVSMIYQL